MATAALMIPSDLAGDGAETLPHKGKNSSPPVRLGAEKGFCGKEEDIARAEHIAIDAERHFNAPAILHENPSEYGYSDNRDFEISYFEILHHTAHLKREEMVTESLRRGYMQGLLTRAIMATEAANAPKKGKCPKHTEEMTYRCQSLRQTLSRANCLFGQGIVDTENDLISKALWEGCSQLCETILVVVEGPIGDGTTPSNSDTLAEREKAAVSTVESTVQLVQSARNAFATPVDHQGSGARVCQLLPDRIVPFYVLLETTARLFAVFGWGKRKRQTKAAAGALARLASSLRDFLTEMLHAMSRFRAFGGDEGDVALEAMVEEATNLDVIGIHTVQRVVREVVSSRSMTKERVDHFMLQMNQGLDTYDDPL